MAKPNILREPDFEPYGEVRVDSKNRITLGQAGPAKISSYRVYRNASGQYILDPQVTIPAYEAWLYKNKEALAAVKRGIAAARAGKLVKAKEDFSKYVDDEF